MTAALRASSGVGPGRLGLPATMSLLVHVVLVLLVAWAARPSGTNAIVYSVNLVAAASGPRQAGIVSERAPPAEKAVAAPPRRAEVQAKETAPILKSESNRTTSRATQTPDAKSARFDTPTARAGGGETGGGGTDVANVRTAGQQFPYPSYLTNIVNQIAMRFNPRQRQMLRAEVQFVIRRDGGVIGISVVKGSGSYGFDVEAKGAVEGAATAGAFGPLPDGFSDDALTVIFVFSPEIIR